MDIKKIGQRINSALAVRNVKQKDLAKILGVTDNTISYFCSGTRTPKTEQIIEISKELNVSTDYLLGFTDDPERKKATADDLCLSALALKKLRFLASCSTEDRPYSEIASKVLESDQFNNLLYYLYLSCQVNIAELIYNSAWPENFDFHNSHDIAKRYEMILQIAESGKYNSVVSAYLRQMVRFDNEDSALIENSSFPLDVSFDRTIIPEIVYKTTLDVFESLKHELCNTTSRSIRKQLEEGCGNGHN